MKASEALEISKINDIDQIQLDEIFDLIKKESSKGLKCLFFDDIRDKNIRKLNHLGYDVTIHSYENNKLQVCIDWKNATLPISMCDTTKLIFRIKGEDLISAINESKEIITF